MLFLLQLLILTGFFVVPNDSVDNSSSKSDPKTTKFLLEIVEELSLDDENARNEGIYKMIKLFSGRTNAKKDQNEFTLSAAKAKEFLKKLFLALKDNVPTMQQMYELIWAPEKKPNNPLKEILVGIFGAKLNKYIKCQLKKYSRNFKPCLMILSVAIRICAIFGSEKDEYSLEAFLAAYHRTNIGRSQQLKIYSYEILPIFNNKNNGQLWHLSNEITSIKFYKTKTDSFERNFDFLMQLSADAETPFSIVEMAQQIRSGEYQKMFMYIKLSALAIEHFTGDSLADYKKELPGSSFWASLDAICINNLSNFVLNLLNRILNSPNLNNYFVHTDLSKELEAEKQFFSDLLNQYSQRLDENLQNEIVKREHYLHFEDAIRINWNPHTKMYKLLHVLKHQWFCWNKLDKFVYRFNKDLSADLVDFCGTIGYRNMNYEQNKLLNYLQTLENFEQIKAAYEKLKPFIEIKENEKCNEKAEEDAYNAIVELNEEFGKAFEKVLEEF